MSYGAGQMFDLVNDIESYPEFLPWCRASRVERRAETEIVATLDVGFAGVHKRFTTRNALHRPHRVDIELVDGPFRSLCGAWQFEAHPGPGCEVQLKLDFEVAHTPLDRLFGLFFEDIVRSQVAAFVRRAGSVYGG